MNNNFFIWQQSFSVNNKIIDDQHKQLIIMLNDLYNMFIEKDDRKKVGLIILKLVDYTKIHFKTEERFFNQTNYKFTNEHIKEHSSFIEEVNIFKDKFREEKAELTYELMTFLKEWLYNHIMISDQKYVECFRQHKLSR